MPKLKNGRSIISLLTMIGFFGIFSTTISKNPVLPLYVKSLDPNEAVLGLIAAISPLAGILFSFPVGMLSDILGKKKLLIVSAAVFVSAPLLYLLVNNAYWLIPIRFFHGMATAILGPVASAIIIGEYEKSKGEKLGLYSSATLIGRSIAPIVGGGLISLFAWMSSGMNYRLVYAAAFLFSLPTLLFSLLLKDKKKSDGLKKLSLKDFSASLKYIFHEKKILGTGLVEMATYFSFGVFETYLPVYLSGIGVPAYLTGIIFSIQVLSIALSKPLFGRLSDNIDKRFQILFGIAVIGVSIVSVTLFRDVLPIAILSVIFGLGMSFSTVATSTYVAEVTRKRNLGSSLGALSSIMDIGHSGGPLVTGLVIASLSTGALFRPESFLFGFMTCLLICVLAAFIFAVNVFHGKKGKTERNV